MTNVMPEPYDPDDDWDDPSADRRAEELGDDENPELADTLPDYVSREAPF